MMIVRHQYREKHASEGVEYELEFQEVMLL